MYAFIGEVPIAPSGSCFLSAMVVFAKKKKKKKKFPTSVFIILAFIFQQ
jgi:hypothetical protein